MMKSRVVFVGEPLSFESCMIFKCILEVSVAPGQETIENPEWAGAWKASSLPNTGFRYNYQLGQPGS